MRRYRSVCEILFLNSYNYHLPDIMYSQSVENSSGRKCQLLKNMPASGIEPFWHFSHLPEIGETYSFSWCVKIKGKEGIC